MSRFLRSSLSTLSPYVPGEQPQERPYIKLNTNESPYPPASKDASLRLYPDPEHRRLRKALSDFYGVRPENLIVSNGSDEILAFAFLAFCDEDRPLVTSDIGYGLYPVLAGLYRIPLYFIPLADDFRVDAPSFWGLYKNIVLANPNAPTGLALSRKEIAAIARANPDHILIVDEAYVDFGAESAVSLISSHENLLVIQTFSKSRALAGARIGVALGTEELIKDLNRIRNSFNPYNLSRMAQKEALLSLENDAYFRECTEKIVRTRQYTMETLKNLGFQMTDSLANFIFVRHPRMGGEELYLALRKKGILVRHFPKERIKDYVRISIGSREEMDCLISAMEECVGTWQEGSL